MNFKGLTDSEVLKSRQEHGVNILTPAEKESVWKQFLAKFSDPLIIILLVAGVLSVAISIYEYVSLDKGREVFFEPILTDLRDTARRGFNSLRGDGLYGVDDDKVGPDVPDVCENLFQARLAEQQTVG